MIDASDRELPVEIVHIYVYDIGRAVDLKKAASILPAYPDIGIGKRRDSPSSLMLPRPLVLNLNTDECDSCRFEKFSAQAKIYDDGALTLMIRYRTKAEFKNLSKIANIPVRDADKSDSIEDYATSSFQLVFNAIKEAVSMYREIKEFDRETYTAFCVLDFPGDDPYAFLETNRENAAALLSGEEQGVLHESQIADILAKPFSYRKNDLAVFDMDRCLVIDPSHDYEDVLVIAEHANYRLLELRALDTLLDKWLDEAEQDIRKIYISGGKSKYGSGRLRLRLAQIQSLRFDALFTLENLDNSSKIIGDYFLGLIYERLCGIFNTDGWKVSVERRLDALQDVYELLKNDTGERRMMTLELIFIGVCIIFPVLQLLQVMVIR